MRPETFVPFVMDRARTAPGVTGVRTLAEAGDTKHPFGFAVTAGGRETRWQVTGQLADGEKHDQPAAEVTGDPAPYLRPSPAADGAVGECTTQASRRCGGARDGQAFRPRRGCRELSGLWGRCRLTSWHADDDPPAGRDGQRDLPG
jgi:hypothetical protein